MDSRLGESAMTKAKEKAYHDLISQRIQESIQVKISMLDNTEIIKEIAKVIIKAYRNGGKVLLFGNGGSAADAQHIAAELVGKYYLDRDPLPAIALTVNTSSLTAISNDYSFDQVTSFDIYKKLQPYKKIFKLSSFKLKSLEVFLNIRRQDTFDGGDLIQVYQSYIGKRHYENLWKTRNSITELPTTSEADILLRQLLLHNADDIQGLLLISPILSYIDLFEKPIRILQAGVNDDILSIRFEISANLPVSISYGNDLVHLVAFENTALITVRVYEGELKYFYDNYKDYYYLPAEDCAIHKSVAHFVEKDYRVKAKPSNCYTKKKGIFAPQYELLITPYFKINHNDKLTFLEIHTDFLLQEDNLEPYVTHLLTHLISG